MLTISIFVYFTKKPHTNRVPFPVTPDLTLEEILPELSHFFSFSIKDIEIIGKDFQILAIDDYRLPFQTLIEKYGTIFEFK